MLIIANFIHRYVAFVVKYPRAVLLFFLLLTLSSLLYLRQLSFDSSAESFLHENDPTRLEYMQFEQKYGLSAYLIVLVRDDALFTPEGIQRLSHLQQDLAQSTPHLASIESIINARYVFSEDDDIVIEPFIGDKPLSADALQAKKYYALTTPYFQHRLVNSEGTAATIIIRLTQYDEHQQRVKNFVTHIKASVDSINATFKKHQAQYHQPLLLGGSSAIGVELTRITRQEMLLFFVLASLIVGLVLFLLFKRFVAVAFPILLLFATITWVLATMALFDFAVQVSSIILPSFLMAVGVADSVHFLRAYYAKLQQSAQVQDAILHAIDHTGVAMFFTSLTTAVGLLSFANSSISSIATFGFFGALGVMVALIITLSCLPALLTLFSHKAPPIKKQREDSFAALMKKYVVWMDIHKKALLLMGSAVLLLSIWLTSQLSFSLNVLEWLNKNNPVRQANEQIEQQIAGIMQLELVVTHRDNKQALTINDFVQIDNWLASLEQTPPEKLQISSIVSILNLLKETNRVLVPEKGYQLPEDQALLAQELLLLQLGDTDYSAFMDKDNKEMRITIATPWMDSYQFEQVAEQIKQSFDDRFYPELVLSSTGMAVVSSKAFRAQVDSMLSSYVYAGLAVLALMMILVRSIWLGLAIMILPNITPIAMVLALMYLLAIPLDMFTILIGSIAIGLIVDDTIHLTHTFDRFYAASNNAVVAMEQCLVTTGKALISTSIILGLAFAIYVLSALNNLVAFGALTATCIILALIGDLLLLPCILLTIYKNK